MEKNRRIDRVRMVRFYPRESPTPDIFSCPAKTHTKKGIAKEHLEGDFLRFVEVVDYGFLFGKIHRLQFPGILPIALLGELGVVQQRLKRRVLHKAVGHRAFYIKSKSTVPSF